MDNKYKINLNDIIDIDNYNPIDVLKKKYR